MIELVKNVSILLCLLNVSLVNSIRECLSNVSVSINDKNQANVTWNYECEEDSISEFKIDYQNVKYKACSDRVNSKKPHFKKTIRDGKIQPHNRWYLIGSSENQLDPYSEYEFTVKPSIKDRRNPSEREKNKGKSVQGTTYNDWPSVKIHVKGVETTKSEIKFLLNRIDENECDKFNSKLGFIRYHVFGQDDWNKNLNTSGFTDINSESISVENLHSNSEYGLLLFVTDTEYEYIDDGVGKPFVAKTKPTAPTIAPVILELKQVRESQCSIIWNDPYPLEGEIERYQFQWKTDMDDDWRETIDASHLEVEKREGDASKMYNINVGDNSRSLKVRMKMFNKGFPISSPWSIEASTDNTEATDTLLIVVVALIFTIILIVIAVLIARKCNLLKRPAFKPVKTDDYSERPIVRHLTSEDSGLSLIRSTSVGSTIEMRPTRKNTTRPVSGRASGKDPLPHAPGEPLYEPLRFPDQDPLDEDNYLVPNPMKVASVESLDEEGYLKPNFNRYQPINTRSPTRESPEPIPMVSYSSQDELEKK